MTYLALVWIIAAALVGVMAYHLGRAAGPYEAMEVLERAMERPGKRNTDGAWFEAVQRIAEQALRGSALNKRTRL
ncbi:MAG: hypothetical protein ACM309_02650 [Bacillota bacterium]